MKCALKPLRDERAREMFAHTAAKRRFANVKVLWAHQIMPDKARQNRILQASPLKCAVRIFRMSKHRERMRAERVAW